MADLIYSVSVSIISCSFVAKHSASIKSIYHVRCSYANYTPISSVSACVRSVQPANVRRLPFAKRRQTRGAVVVLRLDYCKTAFLTYPNITPRHTHTHTITHFPCHTYHIIMAKRTTHTHRPSVTRRRRRDHSIYVHLCSVSMCITEPSGRHVCVCMFVTCTVPSLFCNI